MRGHGGISLGISKRNLQEVLANNSHEEPQRVFTRRWLHANGRAVDAGNSQKYSRCSRKSDRSFLSPALGVHHVGLAAEIEAPNGLRFVTYKMRLEKGVNNSWTLR